MRMEIELEKVIGENFLGDKDWNVNICINGLRKWLEPEDIKYGMVLVITDTEQFDMEDVFSITAGMVEDCEFWDKLSNGMRDYDTLDIDFKNLGITPKKVAASGYYYAWFEYYKEE